MGGCEGGREIERGKNKRLMESEGGTERVWKERVWKESCRVCGREDRENGQVREGGTEIGREGRNSAREED